MMMTADHTQILTPAAEALRALLFPFNWAPPGQMYVPVLLPGLLSMAESPVPFLFGTKMENLALLSRHCNPGENPVPIAMVFLDTDHCHRRLRRARDAAGNGRLLRRHAPCRAPRRPRRQRRRGERPPLEV